MDPLPPGNGLSPNPLSASGEGAQGVRPVCAAIAPPPFQHRLAAHCESGVTSVLLERAGLQVSEALVFAMGSGLFFVHFPIDSLFGYPTVTFRSMANSIFKKACKRLGARIEVRTYRNEEKAMAELGELVDEGVLAGLQCSVYWLEYMPRRFRFPFNLHNVIVYGRGKESWHISDPVFDTPVECSTASLRHARFAKGLFAPHGRVYFVTKVPEPRAEVFPIANVPAPALTPPRLIPPLPV